jgi:membrane peptidoglycan carboxypeptidase
VYGITAAAGRYFGRTPAELNLAECLFLSSILPSPLRYAKLADQRELSASWTERLHALMAIAAKIGTISDAELAEGLAEHVLFQQQGDPPPAPRPPVIGTHFETVRVHSDGEWQATP